MKVIYIHQYFRTPSQGGALRSYYLAKALADAGHTVELITAHNGANFRQETIEGIQVHYLPVTYDNRYGKIRRIISFLKFTLSSIRLALKIKNPDLCYATSTPLTVGLVALALKKIKNIPFYFEVRDLWPEAPIQLGYIRNKFIQRLLYSFERYLYRQANQVVALSPGIWAGIAPYKPASAIALLPNMSDTQFYTMSSPPRLYFEDAFTIFYGGALGRANNVRDLLAVAAACLEHHLPQVKFIIAGTGAEANELRALAKQKKLNNITWAGLLNREQVREYLTTAHATYTSFGPQPVLKTTSPNKFFDSLAAGKLTVVNTQGWLKELVEQHHCGFYAAPEAPETFVSQFLPYLRHPHLLQQAQLNARNLAERSFSREKITGQFIELFSLPTGPKED